jgi:protease-4
LFEQKGYAMALDDPPATPPEAARDRAATTQPQVILERPARGFGRVGNWLFAGLVVALIVLVSMYSEYHRYYTPSNKPQEKYHSLDKHALKKIALIDISGPILSVEDGFVKRQIDQVREDKDVVAVVARIDSPGGTVTGSDYIYHHLKELVAERNLPLVVSMGSVCASGGYYAAMAVGDRPDTIFAEPTTWTGSIGVIIPHFDLSGTLGTLGIKDDSIASGPFKQMGSPTKRMTEEERMLLQQLVDDSFSRFKQIVLSGRPEFKEDPSALDAVATGQVFTADQALEHGLVDKIGFVEAAIARAAELAEVELSDVRCVEFEKSPTLLGELVGAAAPNRERGQIDWAGLLDQLTPRAYYLWTWLPAAMSSSR